MAVQLDDPLSTFARGFSLGDAVVQQGEQRKDRDQQRLDREADRAWQGESRGRQRQEWGHTDTERADTAARRLPAELERQVSEATAKGSLSEAAFSEAEMPGRMAGVLSAEEAAAKKANDLKQDKLKTDAAGIDLDTARINNATGRFNLDQLKDQTAQQKALLAEIQGLTSSPIEALDDPEYRESTYKLVEGFLGGKQDIAAGVTDEDMMGWANKTFSDNLQRGIGEKLPNGWTITNKRIIGAHSDGENVTLQLAVRAKNPITGVEEEYEAPVTKGRKNGDPADEVLNIPMSQISGRLKHVADAAMDVDEGFDRMQTLRNKSAEYMASGGDPKVIEMVTGGRFSADDKGGVDQQLIMFLGDGDKQKGLKEYSKFKNMGRDSTEMKKRAADYAESAVAGDLGDLDEKEREDGTQYTYWDHYNEALQSFGGTREEGGAAATSQSAAPAAQTIKGPAAPVGSVKRDKNGVRIESMGNGEWRILQ